MGGDCGAPGIDRCFCAHLSAVAWGVLWRDCCQSNGFDLHTATGVVPGVRTPAGTVGVGCCGRLCHYCHHRH